MAGWNLNELRAIAGLPLNERYDDDDDDGLSRAERELASKADKELKAKGVKVPDIDPDKDISKAANRSKTKKDAADTTADEEEPAATAKEEPAATAKEEPAAKKEEPAAKKEEPTVAKKRGRSADPNSNMSVGREWIKNHPDASLGQWKDHCAATGLMVPAQASAFFYRHSVKATRNPKTKGQTSESVWMFAHPMQPSFYLHENAGMGTYEWVNESEAKMPVVLETIEDANRLVQFLSDWKSISVKVQKVGI